MPQLPSGRHLAIGPGPLKSRLQDLSAAGASDAWPTGIDDILPDIEFLWLEPTDGQSVTLVPGSNRPPGAMSAVPSGHRLSDLERFAGSLSPADAAALRDYLATDIVQAQLEAWLSLFTAARRQRRDGPYGWDLYDLFAALLRFDRGILRGLSPGLGDAPVVAYLHGMMEAARAAAPPLRAIEQSSATTSQLAQALRTRGFFADPAGRDEFTRMLLEVTWRMAGDLWLDDLRGVDAEAIDIIGLAAVGFDPETGRHVTFHDGMARRPP